jgi:hypothetical protein
MQKIDVPSIINIIIYLRADPGTGVCGTFFPVIFRKFMTRIIRFYLI